MFAGVSLVLAYVFYAGTQISQDQPQQRKSILSSAPEISKDVETGEITSVSLYVEDSKRPIKIPGKLFRAAKDGILDMQKSESIQYHTYIGDEKIMAAKNVFKDVAFSLRTKGVSFYEVEDGLHNFSNRRMWVYSFLFVLMGLGTAIYLIPKG